MGAVKFNDRHLHPLFLLPWTISFRKAGSFVFSLVFVCTPIEITTTLAKALRRTFSEHHHHSLMDYKTQQQHFTANSTGIGFQLKLISKRYGPNNTELPALPGGVVLPFPQYSGLRKLITDKRCEKFQQARLFALISLLCGKH